MTLLPATQRAITRHALPALCTSTVTQLDTIHCCRAEDLLTALPDGFVDLAVTSPPYGNLRTYNGFAWDFEHIARETYRVLKPGGVLVWVVGDQTIDGSETLIPFEQALHFKRVGFKVHDTMIWDKNESFEPANVRYYQVVEFMFVLGKHGVKIFNPVMKPNKKAGKVINSTSRKKAGHTEHWHGNGKKYRDTSPLNNVWTMDAGFNKTTKDTDAYQHPAMFPEELARRHILTWSNPGDTVLDFFMGSGTTAKMARNTGRHFIGCDVSSEYVALAKRRLQNTDPFQSSEVADGVTQLSLLAGLEQGA